MSYKIVKLGGGEAKVTLKRRVCPADKHTCGEPVRDAPGAVYCQHHRALENAGCAEHDKIGCAQCK